MFAYFQFTFARRYSASGDAALGGANADLFRSAVHHCLSRRLEQVPKDTALVVAVCCFLSPASKYRFAEDDASFVCLWVVVLSSSVVFLFADLFIFLCHIPLSCRCC